MQRNRDTFWDTIIEGNRDMWLALRSASEAVLANDYQLANTILEASEIITPSGSLELCYDSRGYLYKVPSYCFVDPSAYKADNKTKSSTSNNSSSININDSSNGNSNVGVDNDKVIIVRIRMHPGEINMSIEICSSDIMDTFMNKIVKAYNERNNSSVDRDKFRIMFMGKQLSNLNVSIAALGFDDRVVQVFVKP